MDEGQSRRIAGLLGPTMIVMIVSEFPLVQGRLRRRRAEEHLDVHEQVTLGIV